MSVTQFLVGLAVVACLFAALAYLLFVLLPIPYPWAHVILAVAIIGTVYILYKKYGGEMP